MRLKRKFRNQRIEGRRFNLSGPVGAGHCCWPHSAAGASLLIDPSFHDVSSAQVIHILGVAQSPVFGRIVYISRLTRIFLTGISALACSISGCRSILAMSLIFKYSVRSLYVTKDSVASSCNGESRCQATETANYLPVPKCNPTRTSLCFVVASLVPISFPTSRRRFSHCNNMMIPICS